MTSKIIKPWIWLGFKNFIKLEMCFLNPEITKAQILLDLVYAFVTYHLWNILGSLPFLLNERWKRGKFEQSVMRISLINKYWFNDFEPFLLTNRTIAWKILWGKSWTVQVLVVYQILLTHSGFELETSLRVPDTLTQAAPLFPLGP